jgi:pyruvate,water dikinase
VAPGLGERLRKWVRTAAGRVGVSAFTAGHTTADMEELRLAFQNRYHHFKLLLNANNRALETMSAMEEMLRGGRAFGMTFIRSRCTRISTDVFQIIQNLDALAPEKYSELYNRFRRIREQINPFLEATGRAETGPLILPLGKVDKDNVDLVGAKMANLGELSGRLGLATPNGFVITARGTSAFFAHNDLQTEIDRRLQATESGTLDQLFALCAQVQQLIIGAPLPPELEEAIGHALHKFKKPTGDPLRLAVRSSALAEDLPGLSFAGQYRSELNVSEENVLQAFKEVAASKYGLTAMTYRLNRGLRDEDVAMSVGCLEMVDAAAGGVLYTRNPLDLRSEVLVINAVWGLPKSVVDGSAGPDTLTVSRAEPHAVVGRVIGKKDVKYVCYPHEGVCRLEASGDEAGRSCLTDAQASQLARVSLLIETHYGMAQDIEWVLRPSGELVILQSRPLLITAGGLQENRATLRGQPGAAVIRQGGVTASPGVAAGPVFTVRKDADALRFPQDAVLVVSQALPRWAPLFSRAAAVVSEHGGMAGHLANVAREFKIPALFGVPAALEHLEPGRWVTVDADQGCIYDGKLELEVPDQTALTPLMQGTPVYAALEGVSRFIAPLHLLDPESPRFRPEHCRTFHDITRFCHEMAVTEMFRFGSEHDFPRRAAKQLRCRVPMQFWVIDLDDGFCEEILTPQVNLDQIASLPMKALWEGMAAVPWQGPPPVDTRGFMSILMEATANPALDPSVASPYAIRNYFMISRNFCSLQSRFGFHFSTVEALVGGRTSENYAGFQFKGGAADLQRRILRARFVADLLEAFDFRCDIRQDAAFARIEGRPQDVMQDRLRILGYLIIHTRQLDMVMNNAGSVNHYKKKMLGEIEKVRSCSGRGAAER